MAYFLVLLLAAAAAGGVYYVTIRRGINPLLGFGTEAGSSTPPSALPGSSYVSVTPSTPDWQSRLTGILGLAIAVVVGAVALAGSIYLSASWLVRIIGHATKSTQ